LSVSPNPGQNRCVHRHLIFISGLHITVHIGAGMVVNRATHPRYWYRQCTAPACAD
jgi:predicted membrane metal-binding protein